jgi:hypothetical protein
LFITNITHNVILTAKKTKNIIFFKFFIETPLRC